MKIVAALTVEGKNIDRAIAGDLAASAPLVQERQAAPPNLGR
jgi:hypothetical protein